MLLLTGLVGVFVVGAVAFLDFSGGVPDMDDEAEMDDVLDENGFADLRAELDALNPVPAAQEPPELVREAERNYAEMLAAHRAHEVADTETDMETETGPQHAEAAPEAAEPGAVLPFDAQAEDLVLVWDDTTDPAEPEVTLDSCPADPALMDIRIGDTIMAQVPAGSGVTIENIALMPLSTALEMGWADTPSGA